MILGIEAITEKSDDSSDCFDFAEYLQQHPIKISGTVVEARLVDRPQDADYSISGDVDSNFRLDWQRDTGLYNYQWSESTKLRLRRSGSPVQSIEATSSGSSSNKEPVVHFRSVALEGLWAKVRADLVSRMMRDLGKEGA